MSASGLSAPSLAQDPALRAAAGRAAVVVRGDAPREACDRYVAAHPQGSSYHRPLWLDVIRRAFGHDTAYLAAQRDGTVTGVLPIVFFRSRLFGRFAVSMPFLNYGGVLADDPESERALLQAAADEVVRFGGSHLELRHERQHFVELPARRHKVAMRLQLEPTADGQWTRLDRKVRNQVRKAEKSGLIAAEGGLELLDEFYGVFARNMRDLGTPVYGRRWFAGVLTAFPDSTRIVVVRHEGRPVAGSLVHWYGGTTEVPWASALREANPLCANVLLYWQMLRSAIDRGARTFDFGRSTPGEGTFHFKKGWGAEPRELVWEYQTAQGRALPDMGPTNPRFGLAIRAWKRLPVRLATALGPHVIRNIP
jgi:FemAB-related protein (PEP-CTERM system-associated)